MELIEVSNELSELSDELLKTLLLEDKIYDFKNGGMYREKCKAKELQSYKTGKIMGLTNDDLCRTVNRYVEKHKCELPLKSLLKLLE